MISQLEVKENIRRYNRLDRLMPGAVFYYQGVRYVMRGQHSNGQYLQAVGMGDKDFPAKPCKEMQDRCSQSGSGLCVIKISAFSSHD